MNVALVGQGSLGLSVFRALRDEGHGVRLVLTPRQGDKLAQSAKVAGVPVRDDFPVPVKELIPGFQPDLLVAAHNLRWVPAEFVAQFPLGGLAYHPSLLPRHRGGDAVRWTVAMGDAVAGGTVYWLEDRGGADTGPIALQDWCHVLPEWDASALWRERLFPMGVRLLLDAVNRLSTRQDLPRVEQDERAATWEPTFARPRLADSSA